MNRLTAFGGAALSGLLVYLAFAHLVPFLGWVALVPLFILLNSGPRFSLVFISAATFSIFAFAWMIPGAHTFTGASVGYGIAIFTICVLVYAAGCAVLLAWTPLVLIPPVWIIA